MVNLNKINKRILNETWKYWKHLDTQEKREKYFKYLKRTRNLLSKLELSNFRFELTYDSFVFKLLFPNDIWVIGDQPILGYADTDEDYIVFSLMENNKEPIENCLLMVDFMYWDKFVESTCQLQKSIKNNSL